MKYKERMKEYRIIREYFAVDDMDQSEPINVLPLTLVDMLLEYESEIKSSQKEQLINFLIYLNEKGLINDYDFDYEEETKKYIKNMKDKKTAVEWFYDKIKSNHDGDLLEILEIAKQKERDQHGNTWDAAIKAHDERGYVHARSLIDFDDYEIR